MIGKFYSSSYPSLFIMHFFKKDLNILTDIHMEDIQMSLQWNHYLLVVLVEVVWVLTMVDIHLMPFHIRRVVWSRNLIWSQ